MHIICICLAIFTVVATTATATSNHEACQEQQVNCEANAGCSAQMTHCIAGCQSYLHLSLSEGSECIEQCLNVDFSDKVLQPTREFIACMLEQGAIRDRIQANTKNVMASRNAYLTNPYAHRGGTFTVIDCRKYDEQRNLMKKVIIKTGVKQQMVFKYFESRCDCFIVPLEKVPQQQSSSLSTSMQTDFYLKWTEYASQQDYQHFRSGKQIVNHIPNIRSLLSDKNAMAMTLKRFDSNHLNSYKMRSHEIQQQTYVFDFDSQILSSEEKEFLELDTQYWLTKDPYGSLGKGIKLFRNVKEIQDTIRKFKADKEYLNEQRKKTPNKASIAMFQVVQKYLEKPYLMHGRKSDVRAYVLIASLDPLVVLYQPGFIRKCAVKFDLDFREFSDTEARKHITNRNFQAKVVQGSPDYIETAEELMMSISDFEQHLREVDGLSDEAIQRMWDQVKAAVVYSVVAAERSGLDKKYGFFQLLGVDFIFDEAMNPWLLEFNTSAGLYMELSTHLLVVAQLVQSMLDIILASHDKAVYQTISDYWRQQTISEIGRWEVVLNEAIGYDFVNEYESKKK